VTRGSISVTEILDDAEEVVARVMAPWGGLLWLTAVPLRLLQAHFLDRLSALKGEASHYGLHLGAIAWLTTAALALALLGRVVFVRACTMSLRSGAPPGSAAWRVGFGPALSYLYVGVLLEVLFVVSAPTLIGGPFLALMSGLAAATSPLAARPGLVAPWREAALHFRHVRVLVAFMALFFCAMFIAMVNLYFVFHVGLWMAGGLPGDSLTGWDALLSLHNRSFVLLLLAGTVLAVEPFWLAALVVFVQKSLARTSGEDLRIAWERLRAESAGAAR
jgi:hypothetical protein